MSKERRGMARDAETLFAAFVEATKAAIPGIAEDIHRNVSAVFALNTGADVSVPTGWTLVDQEVIPADGFAAAEFADAQGTIIIANQGADLASPLGKATPYQNFSGLADAELYEGRWPAALNDAVQFAQYVQASSSRGSLIYVTGFDLGGAEAEAEAQALQSGVAGCVTFGAPGLPGYRSGTGSPGSCVNVVDYGDAVGNWASDPQSELASLAPEGMDHYGPVDLVGKPLSAAIPLLAANTHKVSVSSLFESVVGKSWAASDAFDRILKISPLPQTKAVKIYDKVMQGASYAYLAGSAFLYHSIGQYAKDLGVSLKPTVAPPSSPALYFPTFDPTASPAQLTAAAATTVSADGTVRAPGYDLTADTATRRLTDETYTAAPDSQYDVIYNPTEEISSLKVNLPDGPSYEIFNDDTGRYKWSTEVAFYRKPDQTGKLTARLYDWHSGGSQLLVFVNLPKRDTEEILDYSEPDATGKLISRKYK
jgi:hypothetical protein